MGIFTKFTWLATCALMLFTPRIAEAESRHDGALWSVNQIAIPLDERLTGHLMVQNRWVQDIESYERTVVRPWLSFDWSERIAVSLGYDAHEFENPIDQLENRAWQRIAYRRDLGIPTLLTHFWLEERFFQGSNKIAWRGRFLVGASFELPANFGAVIRNEFFVNLNETSRVQKTGLGENQFWVGLNHPVGQWVKVELGYLMQFLDRKGPDQFNHGLTIGFALRTPSLQDLF